MEMQHYFVSGAPAQTSVQPTRRWLAAFPSGHRLALPELLNRATARDTVWLSTANRDWAGILVVLIKAQPGRAVIVLSGAPDANEGLRAINLGARGYSHLHAVPELFQEIAQVVQRGGLWVGPELVNRVVAATRKLLAPDTAADGAQPDMRQEPQLALPATLSAREADVARAVAAGRSNREIAEQLHITESTVKAHLGAVFEKLGVRDRLQLVLRLTRVNKPIA